jgi:hypothetical protein
MLSAIRHPDSSAISGAPVTVKSRAVEPVNNGKNFRALKLSLKSTLKFLLSRYFLNLPARNGRKW